MFCTEIPWRRLALGATMLLSMAACSRQAEPQAAAKPIDPVPTAASAPLADARLAGLYQRACATCHDVAGTGAPRRGDRQAWTSRESAGVPALVASVRQGKGSMPPMGWCPECSDEDFTTLIAHLRGVAP